MCVQPCQQAPKSQGQQLKQLPIAALRLNQRPGFDSCLTKWSGPAAAHCCTPIGLGNGNSPIPIILYIIQYNIIDRYNVYIYTYIHTYIIYMCMYIYICTIILYTYIQYIHRCMMFPQKWDGFPYSTCSPEGDSKSLDGTQTTSGYSQWASAEPFLGGLRLSMVPSGFMAGVIHFKYPLAISIPHYPTISIYLPWKDLWNESLLIHI